MNQLIKDLKLQAGINDNPDQEGLDLFAQLIIQECADLACSHNIFGRPAAAQVLQKKRINVFLLANKIGLLRRLRSPEKNLPVQMGL